MLSLIKTTVSLEINHKRQTFVKKLLLVSFDVSIRSNVNFANSFIDALESQIMTKLKSLGVKVWFRYVDDTFVIIYSRERVEEVMNFLNTQHHNIKFTVETQANNSIPFLDTRVKRNKDSRLTTTLYHKKTFTSTYLNWTSLTDRKYKVGLICCLLAPAKKIEN